MLKRAISTRGIMIKTVLFSIIILIGLSISLSGCSYKTYFDENNYSEVWECSGFNPRLYDLYETSSLFPESIDELNVEKFYARYDEQLPLGEGFQILLSVKYENKSEFNMETERIASVSTECSEQFENLDFNFSAYGTILGWEDSMEYAVINKDDQVIHYVYVQCTEKQEIEFEHDLLPINYPELGDGEINTYNLK